MVSVFKKLTQHFNAFGAGTKATKGQTKGAALVIPTPVPDDGTLPFVVGGLDKAGNAVALDPTLVTLTAVSDTVANFTVDAPVGLSSTVRVASPAPAIGAMANLTLTVTWNDGSEGPFTFTWPITAAASAVGGIVPNPGTPTG